MSLHVYTSVFYIYKYYHQQQHEISYCQTVHASLDASGILSHNVGWLCVQEAHREEMLVNRLMRQSQQERRIAVQLLQARHEKEVIRRNRIQREQMYEERRHKDFEEAMNRESVCCDFHMEVAGLLNPISAALMQFII